jgi:pimeloyl-ACP methyl ester carboxylesterase
VETTVARDGGSLFVEDVGEGPVVTLLHPGLWDRRTWDPQIGSLIQAGYRVIRYDQRGYGRSSLPEPGARYSPVGDLAAVLDDRGVERSALVGCSMGGALAIDATLTWPDRVWAVVPAAPGLGGFESTPEEDEAFVDLDARYLAAVEAGDHERAQLMLLEEVWAPLGLDDPAGAEIRRIALENLQEITMDESGAERLDPPAARRLSEITTPTLVIEAEHDPPQMRRICDLLETQIPGARRVRIDADHVVNLRAPVAFDAVVLPFLAEHAPR